MSNKIEFVVLGSPISQPRQRHRVIKTKAGKMFAQNYTPKNDPVQDWKTFVRVAAEKAGAAIMTGPLQFQAVFYLPRPASLCRAKDPDGPIPHAGAKDVDNLYKAVADCLTGLCYQDDRQIADAHVVKFYHEKNAGPRAEIRIAPLET